MLETRLTGRAYRVIEQADVQRLLKSARYALCTALHSNTFQAGTIRALSRAAANAGIGKLQDMGLVEYIGNQNYRLGQCVYIMPNALRLLESKCDGYEFVWERLEPRIARSGRQPMLTILEKVNPARIMLGCVAQLRERLQDISNHLDELEERLTILAKED